MDVSTENEDTHHALTTCQTRIHIADIDSNDLNSIQSKYIEGVIVLVWPYSSLTQEASFLVAEKDVLLRKTKGQVKITFTGPCADALARLRAGVRDTLRTSLDRAQLSEEQEDVSTPGKKAGFIIRYNSAVYLEIAREDGGIVSLRYQRPVELSLPQNVLNGTLATPKEARIIDVNLPNLPTPAATPIFRTGTRISSNSFPGSFIDPFALEDGSVEGRGRKRTKFGRHSGAWRLVDKDEPEPEPEAEQLLDIAPQPSPVGARPDVEVVETSLEQVMTFIDQPDTPVIPVEGTPEATDGGKIEHAPFNEASPSQEFRQADDAQFEAKVSPIIITSQQASPERIPRLERPSLNSESMPTPRLQAFTSPGLSVVSPLVSRSQYFPTPETAMSELDASSYQLDQSVFPDSSPYIGDSLDIDEAESHDLNDRDAIFHGQALHADRNAQAAYFPGSGLRTDEVDLDALQEQIDMNNATPLPVEVEDDMIVVEDVASPAGREQIQEQTKVTYPILDESNDQFPDVEIQEEQIHEKGRPLTFETHSADANFGSLEALGIPIPVADIEKVEVLDTSTQDVVQPLPSLLDSAAREFSFFVHDYGSLSTFNDIETVDAPQSDNQSRLTSEITGSSKPHSFDGVADFGFHLPVDMDSLPVNLPQPRAEMSPPIGHSDDPSDEVGDASDVAPQETGPSPSLEPVAQESMRAMNDVIEPENFTQTSAMQIDESYSEPDNARDMVDQSIQPEDLASSETQSPVVKGPRRKSQRLLDGSKELPGLYSEYFTPKKASETQGFSPAQKEAVSSPANKAEDEHVRHSYDQPQTELHLARDTPSEILTSSITTSLGYYVHLTKLEEYYNQVVDITAICAFDSTTPERAKSGPKDFHTSLELMNVSNVPEKHASVTAQIFRPRKNVLPHTRQGDAVVLRGFLVQSLNRKPMLLSTDTSAWAVFPCEDELRHDAKMPTIISGPPIELGSGEEEVASQLFDWWRTTGSAQNLATIEPDDHDGTGLSNSRPNKLSRKSKSQLPPPLELRRSPRKVRQGPLRGNSMAFLDGADRSPSFQPISPPQNQSSIPGSMAPPTVSATGSTASTILTTPPNHGDLSQHATRPQVSESTPPAHSQEVTASQKPISTGRRVVDVSGSSVASSGHSPRDISSEEAHSTVYVSDHQNGTPFQGFSTSISSNNSVSGETTSSRRRRHERRSTSLIHELRDGTQWIDVEDSEIVSVSGSESDPEHTQSEGHRLEAVDEEEATGGEDDAEIAAERDLPESPVTPTKAKRGRPRKDDAQRSPQSARVSRHSRVLSQASVISVDEPGTATRRVTRSKSKAEEGDEVVHELRDGMKYVD